jgi:hypothetical protein
MKPMIRRLERLEARVPRSRKRIILVWVGMSGRTTKVADTDPHLPDDRKYDRCLAPYQQGGGLATNAAQTN